MTTFLRQGLVACAALLLAVVVANPVLAQETSTQPVPAAAVGSPGAPESGAREARDFAVDAPVRLSQWLRAHPLQPGDYPLALLWSTPEQAARQGEELRQLRERLQAQRRRGRLSEAQLAALSSVLDAVQLTGRVRLSDPDPDWLEASPRRDPVLRPGDTIHVPARNDRVHVLTPSGASAVCDLPRTADASAADYVSACQADLPDWAWVVQPDGRTQRHPLRLWNAQRHDQIAPGSWVWAPPNGLLSDEIVQLVLHQVCAQGVDGLSQLSRSSRPAPEAGSALRGTQASMLDWLAPPVAWDAQGERLQSRPSSGDWGGVGLMQTPTARMREPGFFGVSVQAVSPYQRINVVTQPGEDFEFAFRYTMITDRMYGPASLSGSQSLVDKSIDAKLRVWHESRWLPEVALGIHDLTGTGLFSGEYVVASKRVGRLDLSGGVSWGYAAQRGAFTNPLSSVLGRGFDSRTLDVGQGGQLGASAWYHGRAAPFVGLEYETPWGVAVKLEYDSNNYQNEPEANSFPVGSPFNVGLVYHASSWVDWHLGLERGNTLALGVTLFTNLAGPSLPKVSDPTPPTPGQAQAAEYGGPRGGWQATAGRVSEFSGWGVDQMYLGGDTLTLQLKNSASTDPQGRMDRALAVLDHDAPPGVRYFEFWHDGANAYLASQRVDRLAWSRLQKEPARAEGLDPVPPVSYDLWGQAPRGGSVPGLAAADAGLDPDPQALKSGGVSLSGAALSTSRAKSTAASTPAPTLAPQPLLPARESGVKLVPGLDLIQSFGGPDAFDLYQFSAYESLNLQLGGGWQVNGVERARIFSNYDLFKYDAPSSLPRVRTYMREYLTTNPVTMTSLTVSNTARLSQSVYAGAYAGYFEEMYGGVGAEVLYREGGSHWAWGADANRVRQRGFGQDLSWLSPGYEVTTGHLRGYWQTPLEGVTASVAVGQYLAGDRGATYSLSKTFANGAVVGAYFTKTNVSAQTFGEGSFDKGIFFSIPMDLISTRSTNVGLGWMWHPLVRDGGAMVVRPINLYGATEWLGPDAAYWRPGTAPDDALVPDDRADPAWPARTPPP